MLGGKKTTIGDATYYRKKEQRARPRFSIPVIGTQILQSHSRVYQANTRGRRIIVRGSVASIINSTREINMGNSRKKLARIGSTVCFDRAGFAKLEESTLHPSQHERIIKAKNH